MKKIIIAFDCDGTLVRKDSAEKGKIVGIEEIRTILINHAKMKNTKIVVWSGSGELWARQVGAALGIDSYVDIYAAKDRILENPDEEMLAALDDEDRINPDIAYDDVHACNLGKTNIIVQGQ